MTKVSMALADLAEKGADTDVLREMVDDVPYTGVNSRRRGATASVRNADVSRHATSEGTTRWLNLMLPYLRASCQASCSGRRAFAT